MIKSINILLASMLLTCSVYSQQNMLGKSQVYVRSFYQIAQSFSATTDTISKNSILLTYKTKEQYPFYTYEFDLENDLCVSFGIVSRNSQILETYLDMLAYLGEIVSVDNTYRNFVYKIETKGKTSYFTIKQPYVNSPFISRRNVFYILTTEEKNDVGDKIDKE